jgi:hypothetical protein
MNFLPQLAIAVGLAVLSVTSARAANENANTCGRCLFNAACCAACHTDFEGKGPSLAGGRAIETPFGVFYSPNIIPDPEHGISAWSDDYFKRAIRHGPAPDGTPYFPIFLYPSHTGITDDEIEDLKTYIFSLAPMDKPNRDCHLKAPLRWQTILCGWRVLYSKLGPLRPNRNRYTAGNRGSYLVRSLRPMPQMPYAAQRTLGHCP